MTTSRQSPLRLANILAEFQKGMEDVVRCRKCGKPNGTVSVGIAGAPMEQITPDAACTCK